MRWIVHHPGRSHNTALAGDEAAYRLQRAGALTVTNIPWSSRPLAACTCNVTIMPPLDQEGPVRDLESAGQAEWELRPGIRGFSWPAASPRAVLLLQHGYSEYSVRYVHHYHQLIPRLCAMGVTVHAFDMEGHGRSAGRRGVVDIDRAVRDHLAARLRFQDEALPLFLMGHSLGGLVTASSVALDPMGVRGVILSSAALPDANIFLRAMARVLARVAPYAPAPTVSLDGLSRIAEEVEAAARDPLIHHGRLPNVVAAGALARSRANRELYSRWTVPTLILHGTADRITDPAGSRTLHRTIGATDNTIYLVEGGWHELLNDTGREQTMAVVLGWLERQMAG